VRTQTSSASSFCEIRDSQESSLAGLDFMAPVCGALVLLDITCPVQEETGLRVKQACFAIGMDYLMI
jgi:hypothetical protein